MNKKQTFGLKILNKFITIIIIIEGNNFVYHYY